MDPLLPLALLASLSAPCAGAPLSAHLPAASPPTPGGPGLASLPALAGGYFPIASRATGRTYHVHVRLPQGYDAARPELYPVVYVLDGDSLFPLLAATHLFLTVDDKMPEAIVVGIAYGSFDQAVNRRGVDFMPPAPGLPTAQSGAPRFQQFLRAELLPAIEQRYRADPKKRILFGQSRGGSFVLFSAFTDPDLFWARIASNPALPPTRDFFYRRPAGAARNDLRLFVAVGRGDLPHLRAETQLWLAAWARRKDRPWALTRLPIRDGTHSANSPDAYRAALRLLLDWSGRPRAD